MTHRIVLFLIIMIIVFIGSFFLHAFLISKSQITLSYSLLNIYLFFVLSSTFVYMTIEIIALKFPNRAGYTYLASIFVKTSVFALLFKNSIFAQEKLQIIEKTSIIIPLFLFLIIEVIGVSKLLKSQNNI